MQARKHAAPAFGDSFFTRGVATPLPGFGAGPAVTPPPIDAMGEAAGTMLAMAALSVPAPLPRSRARLLSAESGAIHARLLGLKVLPSTPQPRAGSIRLRSPRLVDPLVPPEQTAAKRTRRNSCQPPFEISVMAAQARG
jgi:hypothetical protein